jgi:hypothetical protein
MTSAKGRLPMTSGFLSAASTDGAHGDVEPCTIWLSMLVASSMNWRPPSGLLANTGTDRNSEPSIDADVSSAGLGAKPDRPWIVESSPPLAMPAMNGQVKKMPRWPAR